jgi:hypothetical protein
MGIHRFIVPISLRGAHLKSSGGVTIEQDFEFVGFVQAFDHLVAVARQADLDLILAVSGERVSDERSTARAEWKICNGLFLREVWLQAIGVAIRPRDRRTHGEAADFLGGGDVAVEQGGRQVAARQVVETVARIVFGEQCRRVDLEVEEIPDGVPILGAIESVEGVGAAGIRFFAANWSSDEPSVATRCSNSFSAGRSLPMGGICRAVSFRTTRSHSTECVCKSSDKILPRSRLPFVTSPS